MVFVDKNKLTLFLSMANKVFETAHNVGWPHGVATCHDLLRSTPIRFVL